jgi:Tol biopolymer transport system component
MSAVEAALARRSKRREESGNMNEGRHLGTRSERRHLSIWGAVALLVLILATPATGQVTSVVSVDSAGVEGDQPSGLYGISISADGRYVAFESEAANLVPGDTNGKSDIFVRDRQLGTTERVSIDSAGAEGNGDSYFPSISADGRYVAFWSNADNLVPGDTNGTFDVFVRDRQLGTTERVSIDSAGVEGNSDSVQDSISADGRYVAFSSIATNLVTGDTNGNEDVFVRDRQLGTTERVSIDSAGAEGNNASYSPSISADGRYVAFESQATNLVSGYTNGGWDIYVRDRQLGTTEGASVDSAGIQGTGSSSRPSICSDGRYVAFYSDGNDLVDGDTNGTSDVFVRDRQLGTTERVSVDSAGIEGNSLSYDSWISADGRFVCFVSAATNLVPGDTNGYRDIFVRDRQLGTTERVSIDSAGAEGNSDSYLPSISADGRFVAFLSSANNLVPGYNGSWDVFIRDRNASGLSSLCDPGVDGVIGCPCANPPGGPGRGCDNSAATGGAVLAASGVAYLSMDSLVFTTSGETSRATSLVLQGASLAASGQVFGRGVRCAGGPLTMLFSKKALGGSITAPDFGAGDATVSGRSAASGDVILPGESRWYIVFYRDPAGCNQNHYLGSANP